MNKRTLFALACLMISPIATAKCYITSGKGSNKVGYYNGVNTDFGMARRNASSLKSIIDKPVELFYNQTQGLILDVLETWRQRMAEGYPSLVDRVDVMTDMLLPYGVATQALLNSGEVGIVQAVRSFREAVLGLERGAMVKVSGVTAQDYRIHQAQLHKMLQEQNARVVFIAHSQGNLFANHLYGTLSAEQKKQVEFVHVAPASVKTQSDYLLSDQDTVIKPLATMDGRAPSHTLSWLEARTSKNADWTGHGFKEIYLNTGLPFVKSIKKTIEDKDEEGGDAELHGTYRWTGSIDYQNRKGSAWVQATIKGKSGTWQAGNGCQGDLKLEPDGKNRWKASVRTLRGQCPSTLNGTLVAKEDGARVAVLPFGIGEWVVEAAQHRLADVGIKGNHLMTCAG